MPDLIDRSEVLRVVHRFDNTGISLDTVKLITDGCEDEIKKIPQVDAVPVVRCKDCANRHVLKYCFVVREWTPDDFYCADGERRDCEQDGTKA